MLMTLATPKLLGQNSSLSQTFLAALFFSLHRYFIETATTDID